MNSEPVQWSEEKQKALQKNLIGRWADDIWIFTSSNQSKRRQRAYLRFTLSSLSLKTEIKYAVWSKFDSGECKMNASHVHLSAVLSCLTEWFNHFDPPIRSLMEKTLEEWETSFRDYLIQTKRFKYSKYKDLSATQEIIEYSG